MSDDDRLKVPPTDAAARRERPHTENFRDALKTATKPKVAPPAATGSRKQVPPQVGAAQRLLLPPRAVSGAVLAAMPGSVESLGRARAGMHAEVSRMQVTRQDGQAQSEQRVEGRLLDLVVKELSTEHAAEGDRLGAGAAAPAVDARSAAGGGPASLAAGGAGAGGQGAGSGASEAAAKTEGAQAQAAAVRARAAVALVERIETFVKSQRPALALTVGGGIDARVEVERTGRNEVALRLTGKNRPPSPEDVARIREELRARGLQIRSVEVTQVR